MIIFIIILSCFFIVFLIGDSYGYRKGVEDEARRPKDTQKAGG